MHSRRPGLQECIWDRSSSDLPIILCYGENKKALAISEMTLIGRSGIKIVHLSS